MKRQHKTDRGQPVPAQNPRPNGTPQPQKPAIQQSRPAFDAQSSMLSPECAIGFLRSRRAKQGIVIPKPEALGGTQWRTELKPQQVAMLQFTLESLPEGRKLGRAFFKTMVGDTFRASRRDMRRFAKERKALGPSPPLS